MTHPFHRKSDDLRKNARPLGERGVPRGVAARLVWRDTQGRAAYGRGWLRGERRLRSGQAYSRGGGGAETFQNLFKVGFKQAQSRHHVTP